VGHLRQYIIDKRALTRYFDHMNANNDLVPMEFVDLTIVPDRDNPDFEVVASEIVFIDRRVGWDHQRVERPDRPPVDPDIAKMMREATKRSDKMHRDANTAITKMVDAAVERYYERIATRKAKK